jgi:hypothetical protein
LLPRRAPYFYNLQPLIEQGKVSWERGNLALFVKEPIQLTVNWRKEIKGTWKTFTQEWQAQPGQVLYPTWRNVSVWEEPFFEENRDYWQEMAIKESDGQLRICIVELFDDMNAVSRRELRHIPGNLIGRKVKIKEEKIKVSGDFVQMNLIVKSLTDLTAKFASHKKISPGLTNRALEEISSILVILSKAQSSLKIQARQELSQINASRVAEIPVKTAQSSAYLLQRRLKDLEMTAAVLRRAGQWLRLTNFIERRFRNAYARLGKLIQELESYVLKGQMPQATTLLSIAKESQGIYHNLAEVAVFNPYYSFVHSVETERLLKSISHAQAGKPKTVLNDLKIALRKIEKGAIGEKPTKEELQKVRRSI